MNGHTNKTTTPLDEPLQLEDVDEETLNSGAMGYVIMKLLL